MDFNNIFVQVVPLYTQVNFWVTLGVTLLVWYAVAVGFAHLLFGAGQRGAVESARQGMGVSLFLIAVALACGAYFLFRPADLIYMIALAVTFLILAVLVSAVFTRMGKE
ncbi:hypothetical protein DEIPH_ctg103orf0028 [Deinococcus phoenicis]|uniref:Uncharacterized protein n=1 Tax=Deinococcus phoenicis TaxID=1476583 RepID=A0A016QL63_9DEIO|nr:hypothetical protein [Deinococcus phoenicis]EYB66504.1 hypothetical protein DEIPH_ctg103orf0028 [Deinococcus phoenicis]